MEDLSEVFLLVNLSRRVSYFWMLFLVRLLLDDVSLVCLEADLCFLCDCAFGLLNFFSIVGSPKVTFRMFGTDIARPFGDLS